MNHRYQRHIGSTFAIIFPLFVILTASCQPTPAPVSPDSTATPQGFIPTITSLPLPITPRGTSDPTQFSVFFIAGGDKGVKGPEVGCGDSVVPVELQLPDGKDARTMAFETLFSTGGPSVGGMSLYNALYRTHLKVESLTVTGSGAADLSLSGEVVLDGDCDVSRAAAQIEQTALNLPGVSSVKVTLNGAPLSDALRAGLQPTPAPAAQVQNIRLYLIAVGDKGKAGKAVGCDDSLVFLNVEAPRTAALEDGIRQALETLLAIKSGDPAAAGFYSSLTQSSLKVDSVKVDGGKAEVRLSGALSLGGECDNPRAEEQLRATVMQFPAVTSAEIYINDQKLEDALSLK